MRKTILSLFFLSLVLVSIAFVIPPITATKDDTSELISRAWEENNNTITVCEIFGEEIIDHENQINYAIALLNEDGYETRETGEGILKNVIKKAKELRTALLSMKESYVESYIGLGGASEKVKASYEKAKGASDDVEKARHLKQAIDEIENSKKKEGSGGLFLTAGFVILTTIGCVWKVHSEQQKKRDEEKNSKASSGGNSSLIEKIKERKKNE